MSKNSKLLKSFVKYCKANPSERFWQAINNWSEYNYIFGSKSIEHDDYTNIEDTYYKE